MRKISRKYFVKSCGGAVLFQVLLGLGLMVVMSPVIFNQIKKYNEGIQLEILHITNHLISKSNKISLLQNNQNFSELKNKFTTIYDNAIKGYINCKEYSIKLKRYIKLPIYKNIIELKDINEAFCSK